MPGRSRVPRGQTLYPEHCNFYKAENMMVISPSPFGVINELRLLGRKEEGREECRRISKPRGSILSSDLPALTGPYRPSPALTGPYRMGPLCEHSQLSKVSKLLLLTVTVVTVIRVFARSAICGLVLPCLAGTGELP